MRLNGYSPLTILAGLFSSYSLLGLVVLATTLLEKFIVVLCSYRGHVGILVASTVGSNIFLLSLCMGIIMTPGQNHDRPSCENRDHCPPPMGQATPRSNSPTGAERSACHPCPVATRLTRGGSRSRWQSSCTLPA